MSNLGKACQRQLWLEINRPTVGRYEPSGSDMLKFIYGDITEELVLSLAQAAGHTVTGQQDELEILGVKGHRDAVIDGMTVDVKSASPYSFNKFKNKELREKDDFGYISQLSSYVFAAKNDPLVTHKNKGAFLVINKVTGELLLDIYDFTDDLKNKLKEVQDTKDLVNSSVEPPIPFEEQTYQKSGNMELPRPCSYCSFKKHCWPEVRVFQGWNKRVYLSKVVKEPRMMEIKE